MSIRRALGFSVIPALGLLTINCTSPAPNLLICDRLQGIITIGWSSTGYQREEKTDYKWQPVIKIDHSNKTVLFAVSHDEGNHAAHPKIMAFTENSGVLQFEKESKVYPEKYFLDLNQMQLSFSTFSSEGDDFWSEQKSQAKCSLLGKMPDLIYE